MEMEITYKDLEKKLETLDAFAKKLEALDTLAKKLAEKDSLFEKIQIIDSFLPVQNFLKTSSPLKTFIFGLTPECEYVMKEIIAIGEDFKLFSDSEFDAVAVEKLRSLITELLKIEDFYKEIGGILGYHSKILRMSKAVFVKSPVQVQYHSPSFVDLSKETAKVREAIFFGLKSLPFMAELYPLVGAADRLHLVDSKTGKDLPAAKLVLGNRTLLETLVLDVQAREYLYYKLFNKRITTPIAIMTSHEKNNHQHVLSVFEEKKWFGRPKASFRFMTQPLVPTLTEDGSWCLKGPFSPLLKPGGHGAIWKMARDSGVLKWLKSLNRKKILVRQINNPIAGIDYGLLAFTGWGYNHDQIFGFASCPRLVKAAEGVNVLVEKKSDRGYEYVLSNIEYCDFKKYAIEDVPGELDSKYSKFSSNTNILFADLEGIEKAVQKHPYPGVLVNFKDVTFTDHLGKVKKQRIARLETTMQNISDAFIETHPKQLPSSARKTTKTYVSYSPRHKTISTAKRVYLEGKSTLETPERCFFDLLKNAHELLENHCQFEMPSLGELEEYLVNGPPFIFLYHPALGPLYSSISQKIKKGRMALHSEMRLEIAELEIENLDLDGSLHVQANQPLGRVSRGVLKYSEDAGKCTFRNVKVKNRGIDFESMNIFWKDQIERRELCKVVLHGNAEFHAENVFLEGNQHFEVEDGMRLFITSKDGQIVEEKKPIQKPTWFWKYETQENFQISLKKSS